jgi:hypothetical protein
VAVSDGIREQRRFEGYLIAHAPQFEWSPEAIGYLASYDRARGTAGPFGLMARQEERRTA